MLIVVMNFIALQRENAEAYRRSHSAPFVKTKWLDYTPRSRVCSLLHNVEGTHNVPQVVCICESISHVLPQAVDTVYDLSSRGDRSWTALEEPGSGDGGGDNSVRMVKRMFATLVDILSLCLLFAPRR